MENKQLYNSKLRGGEQLPFYPKTTWSAIVDAPIINTEVNNKFLGVKNGQLSFVDVESIKYIEFPSANQCNTSIGQILNYINEGYNIIGKLNGHPGSVCTLIEYTNNSVTFVYHKYINSKIFVGVLKGIKYQYNDDWNTWSFPLVEGPYDDGNVNQVLTYVGDGITQWKNLPESISSWDDIQDKPNFATVATTGNYNDLFNKPTIPSFENLATKQELQESLSNKVDKVVGKQLSTNDFTNNDKSKLDSTPTTFAPTDAQANIIEIVKVNSQALTPSNKTVDIAIPTKTSDLTNDSNFLTSHQSLSGYATENWVENKGYLTQHQDISNKADKSEIPTKISQLNNDSNFIKNTVNNLTNYYTKTNTYTKSEVEGLIAAINQFHYEIVTVLPTTGEGNVLYLKGPIGDGSDKYEEYVYANNAFVKIGDTSIDLSGYAKLEDIPNTSDFVRTSELSTKQDKIDDLDTIRNGANKGLTALQSISSTDVINALGYTPYNSSNPNGYTNNKGTVTKVNNISPDANGNVTITLPDGGTADYNQLLNKPVLNVAWNDVVAENWGNYFILYERGEAFIITSSYSAGIISWDEGIVKMFYCSDPAQFIGKPYSELLADLWNNYATPIAKTTDIPTKTSELTNDAEFLQSFTETDPTVPDWAKAPSKPTYTASEVGARPSTWTPTKSDVGLGNVGNFKAVSTVANQGLSTTEQANSRNNINAQELLVSGTNIKTINGNSLLGNGNIVIEGGSGGYVEEVYIGTSEPTDPNIKMWIVPNGDADSIITLSEVEQLIDNKLNDVLNELY